MQEHRYKPLTDKLFYLLATFTLLITLTPTVICGILAPTTLFITLPILLFTAYFLLSPLFGYVELREASLYIKYGFIVSREIPYEKIRKIETERKIISPSILSIKNALDHINIKYNTFDLTTVSLKKSDEFIMALNGKCEGRLL
jgi:hypothetical protein